MSYSSAVNLSRTGTCLDLNYFKFFLNLFSPHTHTHTQRTHVHIYILKSVYLDSKIY